MKIENNKNYTSVKIDENGCIIMSEMEYSDKPYERKFKIGTSEQVAMNIMFEDGERHEIYMAVHHKFKDQKFKYSIVDIGIPNDIESTSKTYEIIDNFLHGKEYIDGEFVDMDPGVEFFEENPINFVEPVSNFLNELLFLAEKSRLDYEEMHDED